MADIQTGILEPIPAAARYLYFDLRPGANPAAGLNMLPTLADGENVVVGLGKSLLSALGQNPDLLPDFPNHSRHGVDIPATPCALWCWLRGADQGELLHRCRKLCAGLSGTFTLLTSVDAFRYGPGLDLTGYEDGTENPQGQDALSAAFASDGSSVVAIQKWSHNLDAFQAMSQEEQDHTIGRRLSDNEELDDAPESAHVKRTAQESFSPEAFMLRRSMPWADACVQGLVFVAFASSAYPFDTQLNRMTGGEDSVTDALFSFSRPVSGNYFWCPPMRDGRLNLDALNSD